MSGKLGETRGHRRRFDGTAAGSEGGRRATTTQRSFGCYSLRSDNKVRRSSTVSVGVLGVVYWVSGVRVDGQDVQIYHGSGSPSLIRR